MHTINMYTWGLYTSTKYSTYFSNFNYYGKIVMQWDCIILIKTIYEMGREWMHCLWTNSQLFYSLKVKSSILLCIHKLGQERTCLEEKWYSLNKVCANGSRADALKS